MDSVNSTELLRKGSNMKKSLTYVAILAFFGVAIVGCTAFTKGYSNNPYGATSSDAPSLFKGSEGAFDEFMEGFPSQISSLWGQAVTGASSQFRGYYVYQTSAQDYSNDWLTAYTNVLYNLRLTENQAKAGGQYNLEGAALVLEGLQMGTVTALWGSVPYSQAAEPSVTTTPKFDPQLQVYSEVQTTLDSGIALLTKYSATLPADIFSSQGNASEWIAAGYTAKARYEMQAARHDGYTATELNNVINWAKQGVIATDGSQDFMFMHSGGVYNGDMNLWYSFANYDRPGYVGAAGNFPAPMALALSSTDSLTNDSGWVNFYYDSTTGYSDLNYGTSYTPAAFTGTSQFPIIRASEGNLLIAEAYARLNDLPDALTYLNNAREYDDNVYGDKSKPYSITDPQVKTQSAMLQTIFNAEYLNLFPEVELFNFLRRVDYDVKYDTSSGGTPVALTPTNGNQFPQRLFYPTNELTANPNTPNQGASDLYKPTAVNSVADPMLPK